LLPRNTEELQKLQDDVPRFSNQLALATVREELGKRNLKRICLNWWKRNRLRRLFDWSSVQGDFEGEW
jgi:hypothetical protein